MSCQFCPTGTPAKLNTSIALPSFKEFVDGARLPTDDADIFQRECQLPSGVDITSLMTSTNIHIAPMTRRSPKDVLTESSFDHSFARKASWFQKSGIDIRRRNVSQWQGCSHVLLPPEDQAAHEALHHNDPSSSDSALPASKNKRRRLEGTLAENLSSGEKRQPVSRHDVLSMGGSSVTTTRSLATSKMLRAEPSVGCTSRRRPTLYTDDSDMDQVVQHKVGDGKVAHKQAERKRRKEHSYVTTELEHCQSIFRLRTFLSLHQKLGCKTHFKSVPYSNLSCDSSTISKEVTLTSKYEVLPPKFLHGCQPRNQKPGYTINGTLKATLNYLKHQAKVIEEQDKTIEAQAAANTALKEEIATFRRTDCPADSDERTSMGTYVSGR